jgi:hypothetical protein
MEHLAGDPGPTEEQLGKLSVAPKVKAAGLGGALSVLLVFGLAQVGVDLPSDVAAALATVIAFAAGYMKSDG